MSQFSNFIASQLTEKGKSFIFKSESILIPLQEDKNLGLLNLVADKVINEINYYHGTIQTIYKSLVDYVDEKMAGYVPDLTYTKYKIIVSKPNQFLLNLKDEVGITSSRTINAGYNYLDIGKPETIEQLREIFTHESASKDRVLEEIRNRYSDDQLVRFWDDYLASGLTKETILWLDKGKHQTADELSLIYTAISNLYKNKPVWVKETSDSSYKSKIKYLYEELCNLVVRYIEYTNSFLNRDRLILKIDNEYDIYVNGELYQDYLDQGGRPEVVLAVVLNHKNDAKYQNLNAIKEDQAILQAEYDKIVKSGKVSEVIKKADSFRTLYNFAFKELWDNYLTEELKTKYNLDYIELEKEVNTYTSALTPDSLNDVQTTSLYIVGDVIFKNTNFALFARKMLYYSKIMDEKGIEGESNMVSRFATVDYVTEYFLNQVEINKL